jgi:hypothetical protein
VNTFSINNTQAVCATLVELGRPDFAELVLDIERRCLDILDDFTRKVSDDE